MNGQTRIEGMFAFIVVDDDETEGVPAIRVGDLALPLMGADMNRIDSLRPYAESIARQLGKRVTLVRFTNREEIEVFE